MGSAFWTASCTLDDSGGWWERKEETYSQNMLSRAFSYLDELPLPLFECVSPSCDPELGFPTPPSEEEKEMAGNYGGGRGQGRFNRGERDNFQYRRRNQDEFGERDPHGFGGNGRFENNNPRSSIRRICIRV